MISSSIAVLALIGVMYVVRNEFNQLFVLLDMKVLGLVLLSVILIGVLICVLSTVIVVRGMVSLTNDDLYY
jgi:cell division transport system permease protein